jgi:hypothetical protein
MLGAENDQTQELIRWWHILNNKAKFMNIDNVQINTKRCNIDSDVETTARLSKQQ